MTIHQHIVSDGSHRVRNASRDEVKIRVRQRFAAEHEQTRGWRRWWLRLRIHRAIRRELRTCAPREAMYSQAQR